MNRPPSPRALQLALALAVLVCLASASVARAATTPIGVTTAVEDPSTGLRLAVTVNSIRDLSGSDAGDQANGIWMALSVTITNTGDQDLALVPADFQILSGDATLHRASDSSDLARPPLAPSLLSAGQTETGEVLFDLPPGQPVQSAIFQASGTAQFVIAPLPH